MPERTGAAFETDSLTAQIVLRIAPTTEVLWLDPSGKIYVRGELVDNNHEVFGALRALVHRRDKMSENHSDAIAKVDAGDTMFLRSATEEILRFSPDGKVYVRGELVDDNKAIYEAFKSWLRGCGCLP